MTRRQGDVYPLLHIGCFILGAKHFAPKTSQKKASGHTKRSIACNAYP